MTELDHVDYRLPTTVVPSRYDLRLEPDLDNATFSGEETVTVEVRSPVTEIVLNAAELRIESAAMEDASGAVVEGSVTLDEPAERARIRFPAPIAPGPWRLRLRFTGILNDRLHGFYRSSYKDAAGRRPHHCRHPVRSDGRSAGVSVLGRAGGESRLRRDARRPRGPGLPFPTRPW
jgi:aminopeptidase N